MVAATYDGLTEPVDLVAFVVRGRRLRDHMWKTILAP